MSCHHSFTLSHTNIIGKYIPEQIAEANQKIEDMQRLGILVDSISGALYSPSDSIVGTVANTLSPAIVYEIGQHFKEEGTEGSAAHILAQTLVAAATASLAGNDALTAGLSAGGAEVIAPILADWMYDKETKDLTSEEKNTISAIISLGSAAIGATTGETTDVISSSVAGTVAVEDNRLSKEELALRDFRIAMCHGNTLCIEYEKMKFDMLAGNNDMKAIGTGAVNIYNGLSYSIPNSYNNAPPAAQYSLITALTITEFGIGKLFPIVIQVPYDIYSGSHFITLPTSPASWFGYGVSGTAE